MHFCQLAVLLRWYEAQLSPCSFRKELLGLQDSALPSRAEGSARQLSHQLLKDALEALPSSPVVCAIKMPQMPAKELSQLCVWCGRARPSAWLLGVSTQNDEQHSARFNVTVSLLLDGFQKQKQVLNFYTSEADLTMGCKQHPSCSCSWRQPLALCFVFPGAIFFSKSQVMTTFALNDKFYSLIWRQRRTEEKKAILFLSEAAEENPLISDSLLWGRNVQVSPGFKDSQSTCQEFGDKNT